MTVLQREGGGVGGGGGKQVNALKFNIYFNFSCTDMTKCISLLK
jgi:hypothetical protein